MPQNYQKLNVKNIDVNYTNGILYIQKEDLYLNTMKQV